MSVAKATEDTITALLAKDLEKRGIKVQQFPVVQLPKAGLRKPDLWCHNGGKYPIEAKFHENRLIEAISKVYNDYLSDPGVAGGFAVLYPEQLSRPGLSRNDIELLATKLKFKLVPVFRPEDTRKGFIIFEGTLPEIADILAKYILVPPEHIEPSIPDIIRTLRSAAIHLISALTNLTEDQLDDLFGGEEVFENILQYQKKKYPIDVLRSAVAYILVTQLLFYHVLSKINPRLFPELDPLQVKQPSDIKHLYFDKVLDINYKAVLSYDVVSRVNKKHLNIIQAVISAIKAIAPEKVRGDLLGTIFHDLIPFETRKYVAAFYTNVLAAELLAWLAIEHHDERVADFAVGSGGLLVAAYRRKRYLVEQKGNFTEAIHRQFVEKELLGIDVMPFAAKVAACHLALQEPKFFTNKVLVAIWDSTELRPDKEIPPIAILEKILSAQTKIESFYEEGTTARKKGVISLRANMDENGEEIKLEKCDVVIMNPPFTRQERIPNDYKNLLFDRFRDDYEKYLHGQLGYYGYFVLLADRFLKEGGRMALVLPATVLKVQSCEGIRRLWADKYHIEHIITTWQRSAFSESVRFREILLIAKKTKPKSNSKTVVTFLKTLPQKLTEARNMAEAIKRANKDSEDDNMIIKIYDYDKLKNDTSNWFKYIALSNLVLVDFFESFMVSGKLIPLKQFLDKTKTEVLEGVESRRGGKVQALTITRVERSIKREDIWNLKKMDNLVIEAIDKISGSVCKIPITALHPALRRVSLIDRIDISNYLDYIVVDDFPDVEKFLTMSLTKFKPARGFWPKWKSYVEKRATHLAIVRRTDLSAPRTHLLAFYSKEPMAPPGVAWSLKCGNEDAKILALWFNSSLHLLQLLFNRKETRGAFLQLDEYVLKSLLIPNLMSLSDEDRDHILETFNRLRDIKFPSLLEQLKTRFPARKEIDRVFLEVLGYKGYADSILDTLYESLAREIALLKKMMKEKISKETDSEKDDV